MTPLIMGLSNILHYMDNFCRLCFNSIDKEESFRMQDEVLTEFQLQEETQELRSILATVLGDEVMDNVSSYDRVCDNCVKLALSSYKFIKKCQENSRNLFYSIDCTCSCLETFGEMESSKSLFVSVNLNKSTCTTYFVNTKCETKSSALKRFKSITTPQRRKVKDKKLIRNSNFLTLDDDVRPLSYTEYADTNFLPVPLTVNDKFSVIRLEDGSKRYYCKFCNKECNRLYNIIRHFGNTHEKAPKHILKNEPKHNSWVCHSCGKVCREKTALRQHERIHVEEIQCPDCKKCYKNNHYFMQHLCLPKVGERPKLDKNYICDQCGAKFGRNNSLLLHIKFEHGNGVPHICSYCNKKFYAASTLKTHLVKHTKEKDFTCETCDGRFVSKESLMYHIRTHTGEKPYKCRFCEKHFLSTSRRADHVRIHHMDPSLPCNMCNKRFKTHGQVNKHKKLHFDPNSSLFMSKATAF